MPSAEDLLKKIIKRQKRTSEKVNFFAFHYAQDIKHLRQEIFSDDDEDDEE